MLAAGFTNTTTKGVALVLKQAMGGDSKKCALVAEAYGGKEKRTLNQKVPSSAIIMAVRMARGTALEVCRRSRNPSCSQSDLGKVRWK